MVMLNIFFNIISGLIFESLTQLTEIQLLILSPFFDFVTLYTVKGFDLRIENL